MPKRSPILIALAAVLTLAACDPQEGPKARGGTVVGAVLGGLAGSAIGQGTGKVMATAAGTFLGAVFGHQVGRSLDRADQAYASQAMGRSLEYGRVGQATEWRNPDSGHMGTITPTRTYEQPSGQYCREYQQTVTVGGKTEQAYGTACRQPDGSWKIQSS